MVKMKKIIIIALLTLCAGIVPAFIIRASRTDLVVHADSYDHFALTRLYDRLYNDESEEEYYEMVKNGLDTARLIARVRYTGRRQPMYQCTISEAEVLEVYRGDQNLKGQLIAVYERSFFYIDSYNNGLFLKAMPMNFMLEDDEYYVFLSPLATQHAKFGGLNEYTPDWSGEYIDLPYIVPCERFADDAVIIPDSDDETNIIYYGDVKDKFYVISDSKAMEQIDKLNDFIMALFVPKFEPCL
jgi:hypothetical protein